MVNHLYGSDALVFIDDEKYFQFSNTDIPGNCGLYADNIVKCPDNVKFKGEANYPTQILVWVAMSELGLSKSYIMTSDSSAVNQFLYHDEFLEKKLL